MNRAIVCVSLFTLLPAAVCPSAQTATLQTSDHDVYLSAAGKVRIQFHKDGGWSVDSLQVRDGNDWIKTYVPDGSNGFFDGDAKTRTFSSQTDGTKKEVTFQGDRWSVTYWVDETENVPWVHVKTSGAKGRQVRFKTATDSATESGAAYVAYTAYNSERDIAGKWLPVHFAWPYAVGHSVVDDRDIGYLVVFENATCLPDSVEYKSHAEMDFTYGRKESGAAKYSGYFGIKYDPDFEMQYRIAPTLGRPGKKIRGILKDYLHSMFVEFHPDDSRLNKDFLWDDMQEWFNRIYKDPSYWHEDSPKRARGIVPMECEYDNADGTFVDNTEFGSSQGVAGPLMYLGFATRDNAKFHYWFHKSVPGRDAHFNNLFLHLHRWNEDYDPSHAYDLPPWGAINWRQQWAQHILHLYDITGSYKYAFTPMNQYLKHVSDKNEYNGPVEWDTLSATKARALLYFYRFNQDPAFLEDGGAILDTIINPKVAGNVEDPGDRLPSGPAKEGTAPEACFTSALANVERFLITGDARYKEVAEDFAYMGLTLFSLRPHNNTWAVPGGSTCGSERDSMHAVMETQIDTGNAAYTLIGLLKHLNVPAAYHMLYLIDQNVDAFCFNVHDKAEIGVYMYGIPHLLYAAFHLVNDTSDHGMLVVCPDIGLYSPHIRTERDVHVYNPSGKTSSFKLYIKHLNAGGYLVTADGEPLGVYSHRQLADGIGVELAARQVKKYRIMPRSKVASQGTGLRADYFSNGDAGPNGFVLGRIDSEVDFRWDAAPGAGVPADGFSVVWSGEIEPPTSGDYTFSIDADSGVRLFVNSKILIDRWDEPSGPLSPKQAIPGRDENGRRAETVRLSAGIKYPIRLEYRHATGPAHARLLWQGPSVAQQVIPRKQLYPDALVPLNGTEDITYLSDLKEDFYRQFFWRPSFGCDQKGLNSPCPNRDFQILKKDKSVAGNPLRLGGKSYPKGLGTHNESVIEYTLSQPYDYFLADIGIDDEVTSERAHSGFKVLGDGVPLYDSGLMTASSETKSLKVCIRGVKTLTLQVYRGPHTKLDGHADWADARLLGSRHQVDAATK
jgi:hypothetical protein